MTFAFGIGIAVFICVLLLLKRNKALADYLLAAWLVLVGTHLLFFHFAFFYSNSFNIYVALAGYGLVLLHIPLLYVYALSMGSNQWPSFWYLHFLPYLFFEVGTGFFVYQRPESYWFKDAFLVVKNMEPAWPSYHGYYFAIVSIVYTFLLIQQTLRYNRALRNYISKDEQFSLRWLLHWGYIGAVFSTTVVVLIFSSRLYGVPAISTTFQWVGLLLTLYIFGIGMLGVRQSSVLVGVTPQTTKEKRIEEATPYKNSGLTDEMVANLAAKLSRVMQEHQYYLNQDLSLPELARQLGLSANRLSQVINQHFACNFFDFVNRYRVEEFKRRALNPEYAHLTLLGIAYDCGFASKSSFNKTFKRLTGQSPSEFLGK